MSHSALSAAEHDPATGTDRMDEWIPLGDTGWRVWPDAVLRSTGFPVAGLDLLSAPECAAAADRLLDAMQAVRRAKAARRRGQPLAGFGSQGKVVERADVLERVEAAERARADYAAAFAKAERAGAAAIADIAGDPLLREAITWQNRDFADYLDALGIADADRGSSRRLRERTLVRYWQRYCGKNETVGFFGPICWVPIRSDQPERVRVSPGEGLVRLREVFLERWCVAAYAAKLADDPQTRDWLTPVIAPHVHLDGRRALLPGRPPVLLGAAEATALRLCDGHRPAAVVAEQLLADRSLSLRSPADVNLLLDRLAERELLDRGGQVPVARGVEGWLAGRLAAIGDAQVRARAGAGLDRMVAARDRVALAAGDPDRLAAALSDLDECVAAETGGTARHRPGQMYAGRTTCYEDTVRDLDAAFGTRLLDDLAAPLAIVLRAARWVTVALAQAYRAALEELAEDPDMRLGDLMYLAHGLFWTGDDRPVDAVAVEFARRWSALFELPDDNGSTGPSAGVGRIQRSAAELAGRAAELFPGDAPGWAAAGTHSPDLQICASDVDALNRGDYLAVLGEMHVAWYGLTFFIPWHTDPARIWAQMRSDIDTECLRPLYPSDWPRHTGRMMMSPGPFGRRLGFVPAPRPQEGDVLAAMAIRLEWRDGHLEAVEPDGRRWPIVDVFADWLSIHSVDAFKLPAGAAHQARVTVDRLVVARETWRLTAAETGLADVKRDSDRFLAARRLRRKLGLPDRVFVKVGTEVKPCYTDLTSPHSVATLATMIRPAVQTHGPQVPVTITEALPGQSDAWLPDAAGRRYFSELRLQISEPGS